MWKICGLYICTMKKSNNAWSAKRLYYIELYLGHRITPENKNHFFHIEPSSHYEEVEQQAQQRT